MKASDLFVKALENEGVEYIFGIPGEENLDFLNSLKGSKIKLVLTRHEQGAGFMAATYGRLLGKPGVCISTLGPGATNLTTPAAYAQLGAMPMVMITGQKPIKKSKQEGMGFDNFGLDYQNPDFIQYAESYGATGHRPASDEEMKKVLAECLNSDGIHVIDLAVDYSLNHSILNVLLREKTCIL